MLVGMSAANLQGILVSGCVDRTAVAKLHGGHEPSRDKDKLHILLIRQALKLKRGTIGKRRVAKPRRRTTQKRLAPPSS